MTKLGKYELLEKIGRGGYGTVYRARETVLEVERAVKVLHPALVSDPEFIERFRREAKYAAKLEHPHIVPVYELGEAEGRYYLAMKYMPGGSLKDVLESEGNLSLERTLEITHQVADALDFAHNRARGLVHRDVKPGNILFEQHHGLDDFVRLADFGFAKAIAESSSTSFSMSGGIMGTPAYMAPEIWEGKSPTPAADVYSLACIVFEMLIGKALFEDQSPMEIIRKHALEEPVFSDPWPKSLPGDLERVLPKALAKSPEERYPNPNSFMVALDSVVEKDTTRQKETSNQVSAEESEFNESHTLDSPISQEICSPIIAKSKQKTWWKRSYLWLGLFFIGVIFLLITQVLSRYFRPVEGIFFVSESLTPSLTLTRIPTKTPTLTQTPTPTSSPTLTSTPTITPDPLLIASWNANEVKRLNDYEIHNDAIRRLAWSPNGTLLASASNDGTVRIFDPANGKERKTLYGHGDPVEGLDWSPDGSMLASASWDETAKIWDFESGDQIKTLRGGDGALSGVAWSPDGQRLATVSYKFILRIWDTKTWESFQVVTDAHEGDIKSVAWSSDGSMIATGGKDGRVNIWDSDTGELIHALWGHADYVMGVSWSQQENKLVSGGFDFTVRVWDIEKGEEIYFLDKHKNPVNSVAWSPSEPVAASGGWDFTIGLWNLSEGRILKFMRGHRNAIWTVAWSPNGKKIASGDDDGIVYIWGIPVEQGNQINDEEDLACTDWSGVWMEYPCETCAESTGYVMYLTVNDQCEVAGHTSFDGFETDLEGKIEDGVLHFQEFSTAQGCYFYGDLNLEEKYFSGTYKTTCSDEEENYAVFRRQE